jgi:hypothetical protein
MRNALKITAILALISCTVSSAADTPPPIPDQEQPEILTRGPVHEAFAQPVELEDQSGLVTPNEPPADIVENPPDERPAGKQFVWVPGYWGWDDDHKRYIWVSGCWRAAPPGTYWVPGYWTRTPSGWEWVAGFWSSSPQNQIQYLPAPPALENVEVPASAPFQDDLWVPPCWYWTDGSYVLRAGYWLKPLDNWVWIPSHYVWTPRGYVFIAGRWDYPLARRGVLFTPYHIPRPLYLRPGFSLSLGVVVDLGLLEVNLFTFPRYCHYYFGDYYGSVYIGLGIYPQFEWRRFRTWYDPLYVHSRWRHHETAQAWYDHERHQYDLRLNDRALRPPRTYRDMEERLARAPEAQRRDLTVVRHMNTVVRSGNEPFKFERMNSRSRESYFGKTDDLHRFRNERREWESHGTVPGRIEQPERNRPGIEQRREIPRAPTERGQSEARARQPEVRMPSASTRSEGPFGRNRESNLSRPERVQIPSAPIRGMNNRQGFFFHRRVTPSQPREEDKVERGGRERSERSRRR